MSELNQKSITCNLLLICNNLNISACSFANGSIFFLNKLEIYGYYCLTARDIEAQWSNTPLNTQASFFFWVEAVVLNKNFRQITEHNW